MATVQVLRLAGSPGVGKSAVGWAVAQRLAGEGEQVAYVDIDQLCMCYPAPEEDPDRWGLRERALERLLPHYRRAGAGRLVVSGVACPDLPPPEHAGADVTSLWLDAAPGVRRHRLTPRGWSAEGVAKVVRVGTEEADRIGDAWARFATDGLTVDQTADEVLAGWAPTTSPVAEPVPVPQAAVEAEPVLARVPLLWITGPRCAGASTVGWLVAAEAWEQGRRTGFTDLAQLSFGWNLATSPGLANVAALQETFVAAGAEQLVVVAPLDIDPARVHAALGTAKLTIVRLDAGEDDLRARARSRARGEGPMLAGDDLAGATEAVVEDVVASAAAGRRLPVRPGEALVDTSGISDQEAASRARAVRVPAVTLPAC